MGRGREEKGNGGERREGRGKEGEGKGKGREGQEKRPVFWFCVVGNPSCDLYLTSVFVSSSALFSLVFSARQHIIMLSALCYRPSVRLSIRRVYCIIEKRLKLGL